MNKKTIILGYLLGFLTAVTLMVLVLLLLTKFTVLNKDYVIKTIKNNDYYNQVYNEINEEMELNLLSTGFTNEILADLYTKEEVIEDINVFINNVFLGQLTTLDKSELRYKLNINIDNFFKKTKLTVMNKDELNKFVSDLVDIYKNEVCLYKFTDGVIPQIPRINNIVNIGIIISVCLLIIFTISLIIIKNKLFSSIIISSGLIILFIRLFIFEKIDSDNILIITEDFSKILRLVMNNIKSNLWLISIILIICGLLILLLESMCKQEKKKALKD